jgi:hypothetical protein
MKAQARGSARYLALVQLAVDGVSAGTVGTD